VRFALVKRSLPERDQRSSFVAPSEEKRRNFRLAVVEWNGTG
jgi:hypothetical protein